MAIIEKIKAWYRGRYVPPEPNVPNSGLVFLSVGHYEQPAIAKLLGVLGRFWLANWQWVVGSMLAIVGIVVAL